MAKRARKHRSRRTALKLLVFLILAGIYIYWGNTALQVTQFDPVFTDLPDGFNGCRIAVLSDTQSMEFGEDQARLLEQVAAQRPDYIFFIGDMTDRFRGEPEGYVETLAGGLAAIAPTYYVTGNHEWAIGSIPDLKSRLTALGVTVLSNQYSTVERNGDTMIFAGIDDPNGYADQKTPETLAAELYAEEGDPFWFLLAHRNDRFAEQYSLLGADLVLSGHAHGGIIRLPFTDGLLAHDMSLFPSYTAGFYEENGSTLFVTRGLGNSGPAFRLFNRPEIAILTLHKG